MPQCPETSGLDEFRQPDPHETAMTVVHSAGMDALELMATAMRAAKTRLDVSASNLANVSSDGFRKRVARATLTPAGLTTTSVKDPTPAPLRRTGRTFDLAAVGGSFAIRRPDGSIGRLTSGSFERDDRGRLSDEHGRMLMGSRGPLIVPGADATIDDRGVVRDGAARIVDQLRVDPGASVQSGFLEGTNVDAVHEMVDVLDAQRAFETAQKTLSALDEERQKDANDVVRVKT
jgi:flagellar basal-body rod protein FlgF